MIYLIACAIAVTADQLLKHWVVLNIKPGTVRPLLPGLLSITNVQNFGAAFSILQNMRWLFVAANGIFIVLALWAYFKKKVTYTFGRWSLAAIMAGSIGNCIDRIKVGYVVDMFSFDFINFAIFNIADCLIVGGTILFCIYLFFFYEKKEPQKLPVKGDDDENAEN